MKIFVDENIPAMTVSQLRARYHDVLDIRGTEDEGMTDDDIWKWIQEEGRLLITTDKGFTQKRYERHSGILIVRLKQPNRLKIHQKVMLAMDRFSEKKWGGLTVVMQDNIYRVWKNKKEG